MARNLEVHKTNSKLNVKKQKQKQAVKDENRKIKQIKR